MNHKSSPYKRIMIFGRPGSGKTTFARRLHTYTGIPLYHLDAYFFTNNWEPRNYQEFLTIQQNIVDQDSWIIDGNSSKSFDMRYQRADICLYFNYPLWICCWRILKRFLNAKFKTKNLYTKDKALGCKETISWGLLWYMATFKKRIAIINELRIQYPNVVFVEIRNDTQLHNLLQNELELQKSSGRTK